MRRIADLAETYSHDELRISRGQNIVLPHVHKAHLPDVYDALGAIGLPRRYWIDFRHYRLSWDGLLLHWQQRVPSLSHKTSPHILMP